MGTEGVMVAFVGAQEALQAHQHHVMIGILLFGPLKSDVDQYKYVGFLSQCGE